MEYYGWTTDGLLFDSSVLRGRSAELQQKNVPKGVWEGAAYLNTPSFFTSTLVIMCIAKNVAPVVQSQSLLRGIQLMQTGETRRLWVPPALGYGSQRDDGGPCGMLIFDIFLESFEKGGLFR